MWCYIGGACGYVDSVENPPLNKMISAGGPSLFYGGKGCGACYEVALCDFFYSVFFFFLCEY